jgi:inhibitor of KinA
MKQPARIYPLGDRALTVELGEAIDEASFAAVQDFYARVCEQTWAGVTDVVPAFTTVTLHYDPRFVSPAKLEREVQALLDRPATQTRHHSRIIEIPVAYGELFGPDLAEVAQHCGRTTDEVIRLHCGTEYRVCMLGFTPGFPYLGGLPEALETPRRATPRLKVTAGSVGIAGKQTGIYPLSTPGGWQIIGRTPLKLFDVSSNPPTLLQPGDRVRFRSITAEEFTQLEATQR